jgi:polar amino acid transport system substrate-binding protein
MLERILLCCALLWQAPLAVAALACGEYSAALYEHGALYRKEADGHWSGIDKDVLDEVAKRSGCVFHTALDSRVRIWARLEQGTLDVSVSGIATPEREKFAQFIPYLGARNYLIVNKSVPLKHYSGAAFAADPSLKVGVVKGFKHGAYYDEWLAPLRAQGRVYEAADLSAVLNLFKIGRVQAMLALPTSWVGFFKQERMTDQVRILDLAQKNDVIGGLVLSRQRVPPHAVDAMRKALREMREDGTLKAIYVRHVGPELAVDLVNF